MSPSIHRRELIRAAALAGGAIAFGAPGVLLSAPTEASAATTDPVTYDKYSLMLDGNRIFLWSGEFHYFRLPSPDLWLDVLQKMKAAGYNATSIYFDWAYHSPAPGVYDFTGVRDLDRLLDIADQVGIYVIARPGPYINAEVDSGGFPGWLTTQKGKARTSAADYTAAYRDWLAHVDPIIARHQYTNGTGTVILYQVENEYYVNLDSTYMADIENFARADGITVPFTGNNGTNFATGTGAVDIPGTDYYPLTNCSQPSVWQPTPTVSRVRADVPVFNPEFEAGFIDPWGGPGYDSCRQLTDPSFESVFYKNNIANGATMENFYMAYGGTSWGWIASPTAAYTSYDYGAPIQEDRQLSDKYDEMKRLGLMVNSVASLTATDPVAVQAPTNPAILNQARANLTDNTHVYVLRHQDSTSTSTDHTYISVDLAARGTYTYDDTDPALVYSGAWTHAVNVGYTSGDYKNTESWSTDTGASMSVDFTGTAVRWISSYDPSHGIADVYLDGNKVASVDGYGTTKIFQQIFYAASGLANTTHTLKIIVTGAKNTAASHTAVVVDAIDVPAGTGTDYYPSVPQQPGTDLAIEGRDAMVLLAGYRMDSQQLQYSTSELLTHGHFGNYDVAMFYGRSNYQGETVFRYSSRPAVQVLTGNVTSTWDASRGDLRLNYAQTPTLQEVLITPAGGVPLLLMLGDDGASAKFWQPAVNVLVRSPELVRSASVSGSTLALTGDTTTATTIQAYAPSAVTTVTWNGAAVPVTRTTDGALQLTAGGPVSVTLPTLTNWKYSAESPESQPGFDDSGWTAANHTTTNNPTAPDTLPVLYTDDYGYHYGDVWYRAHFTATGTETGVNLYAITGTAGTYAVWLNGTYLGNSDARSQAFTFPAATVLSGKDNVLSVLVANQGHNEDWWVNDAHKEPRGLTGAALQGSAATLTWRIQGGILDAVRGAMNNGGLYGERNGWSLPGYPDQNWSTVTLPNRSARAGVAWYRTTFTLNLPASQDVPLGITFTDDSSHHYRALLFVNGWQFGNYINDVGPQHSFPIPAGILNTTGQNTIAIAVWNEDAGSGGLGAVQLQQYANLSTSLRVSTVNSPGYP